MHAATPLTPIPQAARLRQAFSAVSLLGLILTSGCGGPQRAAPVDVDVAQATLLAVLEHWQGGGAMEDLRQQSPEIIVQERLWSEGHTLQQFALIGQARAENANWFCEVELTVVPPDGGEPKKRTVTYAVGTDPVLTVFHAML